MRNILFSILFLTPFFSVPSLASAEKTRQERLEEENLEILKKTQRLAEQFYNLDNNDEIKEITDIVLNSPDTSHEIKELIHLTKRRFFLFCYPSDGYQVKGYISFVPDFSTSPLLLFLRGGSPFFSLSHPASFLSCMRNYTVIATVYRGGVSEGVDQYGGDEVNDVQNLLDYFPTLQDKLNLSFQPATTYVLGRGRGAMEMFLALSKSQKLQQSITKAVSLSGLLDMGECVRYRQDMKDFFVSYFGLVPHKNEEEWIQRRNPIHAVSNIRKDLPFLILQGTEDIRVNLKEGHHMVEKLRENGNPVTYLEIQGGDHCLDNLSNCIDTIADWLKE